MQNASVARAREFLPSWVFEPSLSTIIILLIAAQAIYFVIKSYLEYRVRDNPIHPSRSFVRMTYRQILRSAPVMVASHRPNFPIDGLWASTA
jgi:hypothetical protein